MEKQQQGSRVRQGSDYDLPLSHARKCRLSLDANHQPEHFKYISDLVKYVYFRKKSILVSMYRIDFIGAGTSLKADRGVRGFCIILTNS